jgi:[lysine-biosynthesis-protein LysW]--L-2-aminoadipate ligase
MNVGILCSRVRIEEKLLFEAFEQIGVPTTRIDERDIAAQVGGYAPQVDALLERSISANAGLVALQLFEATGIPTVNTHQTSETCADKIRTTISLARAGVAQPRTEIAFSTKAAFESIERLGYPVVIKPPVGSWGR